jgi:hypothetical protein
MRLLLVVFALLVCACPPAGERDKPTTAPAPCTRFGQTCELAPGKLGTCVQRDDCQTSACFVCQAQH